MFIVQGKTPYEFAQTTGKSDVAALLAPANGITNNSGFLL